MRGERVVNFVKVLESREALYVVLSIRVEWRHRLTSKITLNAILVLHDTALIAHELRFKAQSSGVRIENFLDCAFYYLLSSLLYSIVHI